MRLYFSIFLLITGVYLLSTSGRIGLSDSLAMFNVAQSMIDHRSLSSDPCEPDPNDSSAGSSVGCVPGVDGRHYAGFGILTSLVVVPALLVARVLAALVHINPLVVSRTVLPIVTLLVGALTCVALAAWILKLGYSRRTAVVGSLLLAFASPFWHFSVKGFLSEPYFTLALIASASLLSAPRRKFATALAGLAFGMACAIRLNGVILFPAFVLAMAIYVHSNKLAVTRLFRDIFNFSLPLAATFLVLGWANYTRFGSPLKTGYHLAFASTAVTFATPFFRGLARVTYSGEIGIVIFAPWILLVLGAFYRFLSQHRPEAALCATIFLIYLCFFAKFTHPEGGWIAGPRYLAPTLPFLVIILSPMLDRFLNPSASRSWSASVAPAFIVLIAAGFLIQSIGVIFPDERYYCLRDFYFDRPVQPWWFGSIQMCSLAFLPHMHSARAIAARGNEFDDLTSRRERLQAYSSLNAAIPEDQYLAQFPNPSNMMSPNLLLLKFRLMGLPSSLAILYVLVALAISAAGALLLRSALTPI